MGKCNCDKCQKKCKKDCKHVFEAILTPEQEVAFTESHSCGYIKAFLHKNCLSISGYFEKLRGKYDSNIGSHIHLGLAGEEGEIVFNLEASLCPSKKSGFYNPSSNKFYLTDSQIRALQDRRYYINIHTEVFPNGELRGQLLPKSQKYFVIRLSGLNIIPPMTTTGQGILVAELHYKNLVVSGSFRNLGTNLINATINQGYAGTTGPVLYTLGTNPPSDATSGTLEYSRNFYSLSCDEVEALKCDRLYAVFNTLRQPAGEIRGQFLNLC